MLEGAWFRLLVLYLEQTVNTATFYRSHICVLNLKSVRGTRKDNKNFRANSAEGHATRCLNSELFRRTTAFTFAVCKISFTLH